MGTCTVLHRNTIGKNSNISKTTCPILMKFDVSDLLVVPFHYTVYRSVLSRLGFVLYRNTIGKNSNVSETTGRRGGGGGGGGGISMKFDLMSMFLGWFPLKTLFFIGSS